jgi:hypothetical protein
LSGYPYSSAAAQDKDVARDVVTMATTNSK